MSDNTTEVTASLVASAGTLDGTTMVTTSGGVASFDDLEDDTAGNVTLQFSGGSLPSVTAAPSVVTPAPAKQISIVTRPPGGVISAGKAFTIVANALDPFGNVDTSYSGPITVSLASGPSGSLAGTLTVNAVNGVATFSNVMATATGQISLTAGSTGLNSSPATSSIAVTPATPTSLVIETEPPNSAIAGQAFTGQVVIEEEDQYHNLVSTDNSTVITVYLTSGAGALQGTLTATLSGGTATFSNLLDDTAGSITVGFTGGGLTSLASVPIVISPAAASQFVIASGPSATAIVHQVFSAQPTIYEKDQFGNLETNDNSTVVKASLTSGTGPLQGTTSATVVGGIATFTNLADNTPETITLSFAGDGLTTGATSPIVVSPGPAAQLVIQSQPSQTAIAGQALLNQPVIDEEDQYGNVISSDSTTVLTAALASGAGPLSGTLTAKLTDGVGTFSNLDTTTAGSMTLDFTGNSLTSPASLGIVVSPAAPTKLMIHAEPSSTAIAGQSFISQPVIDEEDPYGNLETVDSSTLVSAAVVTGAGPLEGTASVVLHDGVATFAGLSEDKAETIALEFSGGGLTSPASSTIEVSPGFASKLVITTQPSPTAIDGAAFATQPVIAEEDPYGNIITSDSSTVVTAALSTGTGPLQGTTTVALENGVATFTSLSDDKAETIALSFSGGGLMAGPSTNIVISQQATQLVIETEPSATLTSGDTLAGQPVIYEEDRFGNLVRNDNTTVVTVSLAAGTGALQGTTSVTMSGGIATFTNLSDDLAQALSLKFTSTSLTPTTSATITVTPAAPAQLVIAQQPSSPSTVGTAFSTQPVVFEEDRFGNLETTDHSSVVTAAVSSGNATLQGATTVTVNGGVAYFSGLAGASAGTMTLAFSGDGLVSAATDSITIQPPPPTVQSHPPTITGYSVTTTRKLNKKGKATGPTFIVYTFNFSEPMNASVGNAANFEVDTAVIKKKVRMFQSIGFSLTSLSSTSVSLTLTSAQKFANGGQIILKSGLESAQNLSLNGGESSVYTLSGRGLVMTPQ